MARQKSNSSILTNIGVILIAIAVILLVRNIASVIQTIGMSNLQLFLPVFFDTRFEGLPEWLGVLQVYGPFPLLLIGIPLLIAGRGKDKQKAAELAAQVQQQYGQAPQADGYAQSGQVPQANPYVQPGQQSHQTQPPHGQVPPLS
ncbi:hypothetical protein [Microbacterium halotolerans]|uniref:hypothetical protein n=1 Tax=Microbacterium halotolerans TaxID=246613 RepID=UPI000E6ABF90|nr:hypothetical protein [Microbacterium halotolerans]